MQGSPSAHRRGAWPCARVLLSAPTRMVLGGSGTVPLVSRGSLVAAQWDQAGRVSALPSGRASVRSAVVSAGPAHPSPSPRARPGAVGQETRFPHEGLPWPGRDR